MGFFFGFSTLDKQKIIFNGLGEYRLLEVNATVNTTFNNNAHIDFKLQGRKCRAKTGDGKLSNATVFCALALLNTDKTSAQVSIHPTENYMIIFINKQDFTVRFRVISNFSESVGSMYIKKMNGSLQISTPDDIGLTITLVDNLLDFSVEPGVHYRNSTKGLLGNFNGDPSDDLIYPNGTTLPNTTSERQIFQYCQTWAVQEGIFDYGPGENSITYSDPSFVPIFLDEANAKDRAEAENICGGPSNFACIYDYIATRNGQLAMKTKDAEETFDTEEKIISLDPCRDFDVSCGYACDIVDNSPQCYCQIGFMLGTDNETCVDIDECSDTALHNCPDARECFNTEGGFQCVCKDGYLDINNQCTDIDECSNSSIHKCNTNSSECKNSVGGFECVCKAGYHNYSNGQCTEGREFPLQITLLYTDNQIAAFGDIFNSSSDDFRALAQLVEAAFFAYGRNILKNNLLAIKVKKFTNGSVIADVIVYIDEKNSKNPPSDVAELLDHLYTDRSININNTTVPLGKITIENSNEEATGDFCENFINAGGDCTDPSVQCDDRHTACKAALGALDPCRDFDVSCGYACDIVDNSPQCYCQIGFMLGTDNETCVDINECTSGTHQCSEQCINTNGSYSCSCSDGKRLANDNRSCDELATL